jgi:hypothetical protein
LGGEFMTVASLDGRSDNFLDKQATPGEKHQYRVVAVEDVSGLPELKSGRIDQIRLRDWSRDNYFALRFTGKIKAHKSGRYSFCLDSDDGARLFIDGAIVIDNDGLHPRQAVWGTVELGAGLHDLEVQYFQHSGGRALDL